MREPIGRGILPPPMPPPDRFASRVFDTPGRQICKESIFSRACRPVLAENSTPCCFPGAANPTVQALLRKNAPRDVHCPGLAGPLLGKNCPQDSFPGPRNPLRITIRGKSPPDHPLLRCQRYLKCDDLFTRAFTLRIIWRDLSVSDPAEAARRGGHGTEQTGHPLPACAGGMPCFFFFFV